MTVGWKAMRMAGMKVAYSVVMLERKKADLMVATMADLLVGNSVDMKVDL